MVGAPRALADIAYQAALDPRARRQVCAAAPRPLWFSFVRAWPRSQNDSFRDVVLRESLSLFVCLATVTKRLFS